MSNEWVDMKQTYDNIHVNEMDFMDTTQQNNSTETLFPPLSGIQPDIKDSEWLSKQRQYIVSVLQNADSIIKKQKHIPKLNKHSKTKVPFTFIDLFAGIGGMRLGLESLGGKCVFSSEWDKHSQKTYEAWFGEKPEGDITEIDPKSIPDHDILVGGFPCQPFSIAGVSKKQSLGKKHGFSDPTQGTLFFNIVKITKTKRPPVLLLENVKNLLSHDKKRTWSVIKSKLEHLNYQVFHKVIDAADYVPQHRERIYIVCFDKTVFGDDIPFEFPQPPNSKKPVLKSILQRKPDAKYTLTDKLWKYLQDYAEKHRKKGNGFGFGMADLNGTTRTLSARYYKDGSEILIPQKGESNPRRLSPREAARLMGFPDHLDIVVSDTQAYKQFGNAVVPAVIEDIGSQIIKTVNWHLAKHHNGCLIKTG